MFFRIKPSGERRYLQIVENTRDGAATRQRIVATLGRVEDLEAAGKLDALLRSGARLCETALLISSQQTGTLEASATARIGAPMIFGRLWEQSGCAAVIEHLAADRGFGFSLERAVFASVLTGWLRRAPTVPARRGWTPIMSRAPRRSRCTSSTVPWPGSARR
jgi:hypothetical protein